MYFHKLKRQRGGVLRFTFKDLAACWIDPSVMCHDCAPYSTVHTGTMRPDILCLLCNSKCEYAQPEIRAFVLFLCMFMCMLWFIKGDKQAGKQSTKQGNSSVLLLTAGLQDLLPACTPTLQYASTHTCMHKHTHSL